jgi:hypothetical protein
MGEARRRKKLDPNYGKSRKVVITVLEFARRMHEQHGKGIVYFHNRGIGYVLPDHTDISDMDKRLMDQVDYKNTFVVTRLLASNSTLFTTGIYDASEPMFAQKLSARQDWWQSDALVFR